MYDNKFFFHFSLLLRFLDPRSGIRDKHPGSATLVGTYIMSVPLPCGFCCVILIVTFVFLTLSWIFQRGVHSDGLSGRVCLHLGPTRKRGRFLFKESGPRNRMQFYYINLSSLNCLLQCCRSGCFWVSVSQSYGSEDPEPNQNVTDPEHYPLLELVWMTIYSWSPLLLPGQCFHFSDNAVFGLQINFLRNHIVEKSCMITSLQIHIND